MGDTLGTITHDGAELELRAYAGGKRGRCVQLTIGMGPKGAAWIGLDRMHVATTVKWLMDWLERNPNRAGA